MKSFRIPLAALVLGALALPTFAQSPSAAVKPLTYDQVTKLLAGGDDAKISKAVVGKTIAIKLVSAGPDTLVVRKGDGVYFICETRAPGFKSGPVTAKVVKFESTHEGDLSLSLDKCGS